jgi:hypothetical protein
MKTTLVVLAACVSFGNCALFAWRIFTRKTSALNVPSWLMFSLIQATILINTIVTKQPFGYSLGLTIGTVSVFLACALRGGDVRWTKVAILSAACAGTSTAAMSVIPGDGGVIAGVVALNISGIPWVIEIWEKPNDHIVWMFILTIIACLLTLFAVGWPPTIGGWFFPISGILFNGMMLMINAREPEDTMGLDSD